jgi:8-amino-7-oxononanoate synthase
VLEIKNELFKRGFAVGGIRQPTVPRAIIRLIARLGESESSLKKLCQNLKEIKNENR